MRNIDSKMLAARWLRSRWPTSPTLAAARRAGAVLRIGLRQRNLPHRVSFKHSSRNVTGLGGAHRRQSGLVWDHLIGDVLVEIFLQCRSNGHDVPSMREASLALVRPVLQGRRLTCAAACGVEIGLLFARHNPHRGRILALSRAFGFFEVELVQRGPWPATFGSMSISRRRPDRRLPCMQARA